MNDHKNPEKSLQWLDKRRTSLKRHKLLFTFLGITGIILAITPFSDWIPTLLVVVTIYALVFLGLNAKRKGEIKNSQDSLRNAIRAIQNNPTLSEEKKAEIIASYQKLNADEVEKIDKKHSEYEI